MHHSVPPIAVILDIVRKLATKISVHATRFVACSAYTQWYLAGTLDMRERMRHFDGLMTDTGPTGPLSPGLWLPPGEGYRHVRHRAGIEMGQGRLRRATSVGPMGPDRK